eukprot:10865266-Heterocapsa_arctica.AAC.1
MMGEQMVGHVENHSTKIGKDQYRYWDRNMNKLTDSLKEDSGEDNSQEKEHGLHILRKHRSKEEQHDTKWKYREKCRWNHSDTEE